MAKNKCDDCVYRGTLENRPYCEYIFKTDHSRPCPPGDMHGEGKSGGKTKKEESRGMKMAKEVSKLKALSTIQRALGLLEGLSYGAEQAVGEGIMDAVAMLDAALKVVLEDG